MCAGVGVYRRHISEHVNVPAEGVLVLEEPVVVSILRDWATLSALLLVWFLGNEWLGEPTDLLRRRLLPHAPLPRDSPIVLDSLLHRLLLKDPFNSGGVELELALGHWSLVREDVCGPLRVHLSRLLRNELHYSKQTGRQLRSIVE